MPNISLLCTKPGNSSLALGKKMGSGFFAPSMVLIFAETPERTT